MIYLIFSIISSVTIALLVKRNENRALNRITIILYNYITISVVLFAVNLVKRSLYFDLHLFILGAFVGLLFALNFIIYMRLINTSEISLPTLAMRISLVIPITLSILLYGETVTVFRGVGLLLAILSIGSMYNPSEHTRDMIFIVLLFVFAGLADFSMKYFEMNFKLQYELSFMMYLFTWAGVFTFLFNLFRRKRSGKEEILGGIVLAVPNLLTSFFLILALKYVEAVVAFPINNISIIILSAVLSKVIFHESFSRRKILSFIFGILAIVILSMNI